jgi:hypothetical protein
MRPIFSSVLAVVVGALLAPSCYAEREPPPNFRYSCDSAADCRDGQSCVEGLCETPCTQDNFEEVCVNGELTCLNGVCSSVCDLANDTCPGPQKCADVGIDGGGGGGLFGGGGDVMVGVCMRPCTNDSCGELSVCLEGFCVQTCVDDMDCAAGTTCAGNLCLPDFLVDTTSDSMTDTLTTAESSSSDGTATITDTITDSGTDTGMDSLSASDTLDTATATGGGT